MDTNQSILYITGHETPWKSRNARKAAAARLAAAEIRSQLPLCVHTTELIAKLGRTLVSGVPQEGMEGPSASAHTWTASDALSGRQRGACPDLSRRPFESRLFHGSLDTEACWGSNPKALWDRVFHFKSLAIDEGSGLELPDAGEKSQGAKRTCHRLVEASGVARDKKKPKSFTPISFSRMKAGSCWYRALPAHGRRWEERLILRWPEETGRRYRPSRLSVSLQEGSISLSTSSFTPTGISEQNKFSNSSGTFSRTFEVRLSCCGTIIPSIGQNSLSSFFVGTVASMIIFSPDTRRSSTPTSSFGRISREPSPICVCQKTCDISGKRYRVPSVGFDVLNHCCGRAFVRRIYHGCKYVSII